jgi:hypothetical protein
MRLAGSRTVQVKRGRVDHQERSLLLVQSNAVDSSSDSHGDLPASMSRGTECVVTWRDGLLRTHRVSGRRLGVALTNALTSFR